MPDETKDSKDLKFRARRLSIDDLVDRLNLPFNRFFLFLLLAVAFALLMGGIGYGIYRSSDAASLDLSRPGYQSSVPDDNIKREEPSIENEGDIDASFAHKVISASDHYRSRVGDVAPFSPEALLDENLIPSTLSQEP